MLARGLLTGLHTYFMPTSCSIHRKPGQLATENTDHKIMVTGYRTESGGGGKWNKMSSAGAIYFQKIELIHSGSWMDNRGRSARKNTEMAASFMESATPCADASHTSLHVILRTALSSRCSAHSHFPEEESGSEELCGSPPVAELDPGFKHRSA